MMWLGEEEDAIPDFIYVITKKDPLSQVKYIYVEI